MSRHVRTGRYEADRGSEIVDVFESWARQQTRRIQIGPDDVVRATALVRRFDLGLRAPDALHLALCERAGADLLSFDGNQSAAAAVIGIALAA